MRRLSVCSGPLLLLLAVVGCDGVTVALDRGSLDAAVADDPALIFDAGNDDASVIDAGSSGCRSYCKSLVDCSVEQSQSELTRRYGGSTCRNNGIEPPSCEAYCELAEPNSRLCARCAELCDLSCLSESCAMQPYTLSRFAEDSIECWFGEIQPIDACVMEPGAGVASIGTDPSDPFMSPFRYDDVATVTSSAPLTLSTPERVFLIQTSLVNTVLVVGDTVHLRLEVDCSFWCSSSAFVIRSRAGELIWAGWSGRRPLSIPELDVAFEPDRCLSTNQFGAQTIHFVARVDGEPVSSGESIDIGSLRFHNGVSKLLFAITVSDIEHELFAGAIERIQ